MGSTRRIRVSAAAIVAIVALAAVMLTSCGDDKKATPTSTTQDKGGEIFLRAASDTGPDPFTPSAAEEAPTSTIPATTRITLGPKSANGPAPTAPVFAPAPLAGNGETQAISALSGKTPGLYGGTLNQASCDKQQMIDFLAANADKARAWADVQDIAVEDIGSYINGLTSVQLRSDTRVTNHGFVNGIADEHQDILQAGTAVMVDQYGVPRARCACGNPLLPPRPVATTPSYQGTPWTGFNPAAVTVIDASTTIIKTITIINVTNGKLLGRRTGPNGGPDRQLPGRARPPTTGPTSTTLPGFTPPGVTLPPIEPPPGTQPPGTQPAGTQPPGTQPPATQPPATQPPTTVPADFVLVSSSKVDGELAYAWTTNKDAGTANITLNPTTIGNYFWTVPQRIKPEGTTFSWGGEGVGNLNILIVPRGEGISFSRTDLAVDVTNARGEKSAVVKPIAAQEVKFIIGMGYGPTFTYTYRR